VELQARIARFHERERERAEAAEWERVERERREAEYLSREQREAEAYTERWHRVMEWAPNALDALPGFEPEPSISPPQNERVEHLAFSCVRDLDSSDEALEKGLPLANIDFWVLGPRESEGGRRRVTITARVWVVDRENEDCYDPSWITLGWGISAHSSSAAARRYVRDYCEALAREVVSREFVVTAIEVKFWTASHGTAYV
jgi:hypothetical protein